MLDTVFRSKHLGAHQMFHVLNSDSLSLRIPGPDFVYPSSESLR